MLNDQEQTLTPKNDTSFKARPSKASGTKTAIKASVTGGFVNKLLVAVFLSTYSALASAQIGEDALEWWRDQVIDTWGIGIATIAIGILAIQILITRRFDLPVIWTVLGGLFILLIAPVIVDEMRDLF